MAPTRYLLVPANSVPQRNAAKMDTRTLTPRFVNPQDLLHPQPSNKPRKRERLTTLTPEQKMDRRKMKNRVAAQTARDRKKERTCGLEEAVAQLVEENKTLREENKALQLRLARLEERERMRKVKNVDMETSALGSAEGTDRVSNVNPSSSSVPFLPPEDIQFILQDIQDIDVDQLCSELCGPPEEEDYQRGNYAASSPEDSYALSISPSSQVAVQTTSPMMEWEEEGCGPLVGHDHLLYSPLQDDYLFDPLQIEHDSSSALSFHDYDGGIY